MWALTTTPHDDQIYDLHLYLAMMEEELCEPMNKDGIDAAFAELDADGSGNIDFEEFLSWFINDRRTMHSPKLKAMRSQLKARKKFRRTQDLATLAANEISKLIFYALPHPHNSPFGQNI